MGQAKNRGSFEERRQQSINRSEREHAAKIQAEADWWNSLTDEQKENVRRNRARRARNMQALAMWMGAAASLSR